MRKNKTKTKRSCFLGGGFVSFQYYYVLPIVVGFCKSRGIQTIILEQPPPDRIAATQWLQDLLADFHLETATLMTPPHRFRGEAKMRKLQSVVRAFLLERHLIKQNLSLHSSWDRVQLLHAIYDSELRKRRDGQLDPDPVTRKKIARQCVNQYQFGKRIGHKIDAAFLGHSVYRHRALFAGIRRQCEEIYIHFGGVLVRQGKTVDRNHVNIGINAFNIFRKKLPFNYSKYFWEKRIEGSGLYEDAAVNLRGRAPSIEGGNYIFLHVFRDSPFSVIRTQRLFRDYLEWMEKTLGILAGTREFWRIKKHPSALRWGEDQDAWLDALGRHVFPQGWPSNLEVVADNLSNLEVIRSSNRIVTYSGTVQLEAAALGKKAIVAGVPIGEESCSEYCYCPSTIEEYSDLILKPFDKKKFSVTPENMVWARDWLAVVEDVLPIRSEVGARAVYAGDSKKVLENVEANVALSCCEKKDSLGELGRKLAEGCELSFRSGLAPRESFWGTSTEPGFVR